MEGMCIELDLLEGTALWSSGEKRGWGLDKEQTSKDPTSLGHRGKHDGVSALLG